MRIHDAGRVCFVWRIADWGGRVGEEAGLSPLSIFKKNMFFAFKYSLGYISLEESRRNHRAQCSEVPLGDWWRTLPFKREPSILPVDSTSLSVLSQISIFLVTILLNFFRL